MDDPVVGCILAGGLARRMGGRDKAFVEIAGRPVVELVIERLQSQVDAVVLNANGNPERFGAYGLPVVADPVGGHVGPLAGVLAGLEWAAVHAGHARWVVTAATDTPFFPGDLAARLVDGAVRSGADMACAMSDGRHHPVFGLWPVSLADSLRRAVADEGVRKVDAWTARYRLATVEFDASAFDPFFNVNRPDDVAEAERLLRSAVA